MIAAVSAVLLSRGTEPPSTPPTTHSKPANPPPAEAPQLSQLANEAAAWRVYVGAQVYGAQVSAYFNDLALASFYAGVEAQARAQARQVPAPQPQRVSAPSGGSDGCGGATNGADQYIQRESGGNPNISNTSSGAYGCFQILPSTWASSCSDLGQEYGSAPSTQAECASRLPLSAWGG